MPTASGVPDFITTPVHEQVLLLQYHSSADLIAH
jgi:hypothetical protein